MGIKLSEKSVRQINEIEKEIYGCEPEVPVTEIYLSGVPDEEEE